MNKITDKLWLGNSSDANNVDGLLANKITAILNVAVDLPTRWEYPFDPYVVAHCGLVDGPGNPTALYSSAVLQLLGLIEQGHTVLIHCHEGRSRSPAIVLAYLLISGTCKNVLEATQYLIERRPQMNIQSVTNYHLKHVELVAYSLSRTHGLVY
jgi:protein-tyrosine phosphatase